MSVGFAYRVQAPRKVIGSVVVNILALPFTFLLEKSAEADVTTDPGVITWRGEATCPGFTADYILVQGYDQTLMENSRQRMFFKLNIGAGTSVLAELGPGPASLSGWFETGLVYAGMNVITNTIPASVLFEPSLRGVTWANYP